MPRIDLENILKGLSDEIVNNSLSPINQRPKISKFDNSTKKKKNKNELGLPSILRPVNDLPLVSLSDRPLPSPKEEYVSEEFTTKEAQQVQDSFDILDSAIDFTLEVVDEISIKVPDVRSIQYPKVIKGGDFIGYDVDFQISFLATTDTSYVNVGIGRVQNALRVTPNARNKPNQQKGRDVDEEPTPNDS